MITSSSFWISGLGTSASSNPFELSQSYLLLSNIKACIRLIYMILLLIPTEGGTDESIRATKRPTSYPRWKPCDKWTHYHRGLVRKTSYCPPKFKAVRITE